jgi:peptide/nickel transport system substrate-binding protein
MMPDKKRLMLALLMIAVLVVMAACTPSEAPVVTVIVTDDSGGEIIVTATPDPDATEPSGGGSGPGTTVIPADAMVACSPLPEVPAPAEGAVAAVPAAFRAAVPAYANPIRVNGSRIAPSNQTGNIYKVGVFEDVTTTNFWASNGPDNTVWNGYMLPQRLAMYGLTEVTFQLVPGIAADVVPPDFTEEDGKFIADVKLRDDITWSDGTPFTAADIAFTGNTALRFGLISGNWVQWFDPAYLESIEAVDDTTVRYIYHTKPGWARHEYGTLQAPILSAAFWGPLVDEAAAPIDALGEEPAEEDLVVAQTEATNALFAIDPSGEPLAGSFVFKLWTAGSSLENSANADYYDSGSTLTYFDDGTFKYDAVADTYDFMLYGEGTGAETASWGIGPNVDSVIYTIYGSQDAALLALQDGDVDFVLNSLGLQRGLADRVRTDPNLTVLENPTNGFRYMSFNVRRQPMNDCAFRQAVAVLIDKEFVTQTILQGVAFPLYSFVPEANAAWYSNEAPHIGEGLTREQRVNYAITILETAGFSWEGEKPAWDPDNLQVVPGGTLLLPDGTPVPELNLYAPSAGYDPLRSTFAIWIETWLNEVGIPLRANLQGFNVLVPRIFTEQDFDMYILGWSLGVFPAYLNDFFDSDQAVTDGNNAGGYNNPEFDALGDRMLECRGYELCKEAADEVQMLLSSEVPYVVLFDTGIIEAYRSASVEFPYTEQLSGLQYTHGNGVLQGEVNVK